LIEVAALPSACGVPITVNKLKQFKQFVIEVWAENLRERLSELRAG